MGVFSSILTLGFAIASVALVIQWFGNNMQSAGAQGFDWDPNSKMFNYHPVLMVSAFVLCNPFAVLCYRNFSFLPKNARKTIHFFVQTLALCLASSGLYAVFEPHKVHGYADLNRSHGWVGITGFTFFCLNYVIGALSFTPVGGPPVSIRVRVMPYHVILGICALVLTFAAVFTGILEYAGFESACGAARGFKLSDLSKECRIINGLLVTVMATLVFTFFSLLLPAHKSLAPVDKSDKLLS
eukprot:c4454_g1_i1.p1 GENE.c4454_g1_i1~~c4454_g1_i1.p1  ORF type:complete len:241 (+),score=34.35 c4454_g1_i1:52-774(+)